MSPEEMNKLLDAAKPAVIEALKKELTQAVTWEAKNIVVKEVTAHITTWTQENVLPEITKQLIESKDGIISLGAKLGPTLVDELVKGFTSALSENLKSSWKRQEIFKKMFE